MKFNRINIDQLAKQYNINHKYIDILRQTTIERIVNDTTLDLSKQELIDLLLSNVKNLLELMIK